MNKEEKLRKYITEKVNPIFEKFMIDLLNEQPEKIIPYTVKWMNINGMQYEQSSEKEQSIQVTQKAPPLFKSGDTVWSEEEEDNEDDYVDELPEIDPKKKMKGRSSVSAEAYGSFNKKENFIPRVIPKTPEQYERIKNKLVGSFMFQALDKKELDLVIKSMEIKLYKEGDSIIEQGEDGDNLYIVETGEQDCYKRFKPNEDEKHLKVYKSGESFGELSLLYNVPRAASIRAKTDSILFALDRACFNNIVKESAVKRREKYEDTLKKIDILSSLDPYELGQICDGIVAEAYKPGDYIIKQGDQGDKFYMIDEGKIYASKNQSDGTETKVFEFKPGDYFGELALIKNVPRQANVIAETECNLLSLDQGAFRRMLGPIEDILARNSDRYDKYIKNQQ